MDEARRELEAALELDPNDAGAHQTLGMVLRQKGDLQAAGVEFAKSEAINKTKVDFQAATLATNSGAALLRRGEVARAIEKLQAALHLAPGFAPAHYQMGLALRAKGDKGQAAEEFQKAHQLDPHFNSPRD